MISNRAIIGTAIAAIVAGLLAIILFQMQSGPDDEDFELLTPEEQSEYQNKGSGPDRAIAVLSDAGPTIEIAAPKGFTLSSPVDFDIRVAPRDGVPVDMSSLRIDYRLGPAWVNMTSRIMRYASVEGSRLFARGADLPRGDHALRVSIRDTQERVTQATVAFTVAD